MLVKSRRNLDSKPWWLWCNIGIFWNEIPAVWAKNYQCWWNYSAFDSKTNRGQTRSLILWSKVNKNQCFQIDFYIHLQWVYVDTSEFVDLQPTHYARSSIARYQRNFISVIEYTYIEFICTCRLFSCICLMKGHCFDFNSGQVPLYLVVFNCSTVLKFRRFCND